MVSTPIADPFGTGVSPSIRGVGPQRHIGHDTATSPQEPAAFLQRPGLTPARTGDRWVSPALHGILERIVGKTREATGADTCALLHLGPTTGTLQPRIVAGEPLAFSLASAAMNPLPSTEPVRIDLADDQLAGCICWIPNVGALLLTWSRRGVEPDLGIVELAARFVVAAVDQDRALTLDLSTWRCVDTALSATGEPIVARDAAGRLFHVSASARGLLGIPAGTSRKFLREPAFIRALDLRDQWGLRIDPSMLPSSRLRAGKPAPDLVVSARHHRIGRQWLLLHAEAIRDGHGKITVVLTTLRNFTVVQRYDESHWLRARVTEHLHRRPLDLASIEHDIAAFVEGTCTIGLVGKSSRSRPLDSAPLRHIGMQPEADDGATELRLACGHLHSHGPREPLDTRRVPVALSHHVVDIPVSGDDELLGHMICRREAFRPCFDQSELELLAELADQIGLALEVSRLRASLDAGERLLVDIGQRLQDAEESERRRMALSIHDGIAQVAASVCQQLEIIAHRFVPSSDAEEQELQRAQDLARRTVQEARQLIAGLRPATLEAHGLGVAVWEDIEALRCDGWTVRFIDGLAGTRFAPDLELEVYRIVQESLANARKHAGLSTIEVWLERRGAAIHFEVRDHGAGFDPSTLKHGGASGSHVGLGGMHERIARIGGTLHIEAAPTRGTRVTGDVPI